MVWGLLAAPPIAQTQPAGQVWRIGLVSTQTPVMFRPKLNAFRQNLRDLGYVEGRYSRHAEARAWTMGGLA